MLVFIPTLPFSNASGEVFAGVLPTAKHTFHMLWHKESVYNWE